MGIVARESDRDLLSAIDELALYLHEDPRVTACNVGNSFYLVAEEWEKKNPTTPEEIHQFYREARSYLWNLTFANYGIPHQNAWRTIARTMAARGSVPERLGVLDVGAGIGSVILAVADAEILPRVPCVHADVDGVLFRYAAWRYRSRGRNAEAVEMVPLAADYLRHDPLEKRRFHAIVCTEVLEHVPDPEALVAFLARHAAPGAELLATVSFDDDHGLFPCHLNTDKYTNTSFVNEVFPRYGFRQETEITFRKV